MASKRAKNQTMPQKRIKQDHGRITNNTTNNPTVTFNLPDDVIQIILSFLPIKHAVRCGLLSSRFKNSWRFNRNLIFDIDFASHRSRADFMNVVGRVFDLHSGPKIQKFHLYFNPTYVEGLVEYWIESVTLKGVEELDLDFTQAKQPFKLPSQLLEVESIRFLKLNFCQLDLPLKFKGLSLLKTLTLWRVEVTPTLITTIFSNFLLLEGLDLVECSRISHLNILAQNLKKFKRLAVGNCWEISRIDVDAPNLSALYYRGDVCNIYFYSPMLNLDDVILNFVPTRGFPQLCEVSDLMISLSHVRILKISSTFLEKLSSKFVDGAYREVQFFLWNLKEFRLLTERFSFINPYDIVSFLKNCPNLERVFLDLSEFSFECGYYWEFHAKHKFEQCNPPFQQLKRIVMKDFNFQKLELQMLKFFLNKARFLESLSLSPSKNCQSKIFSQDLHAFDQLFQSWKASPNAKIGIFRSVSR